MNAAGRPFRPEASPADPGDRMPADGPSTSTPVTPGPADAAPAPPRRGTAAAFAELKTRLEAGEVHRFVHELWPWVTSRGTPASGEDVADPAMVTGALLQGLAALQLGGAARRLLEAHPPPGVDVAALDAQFARLPDGRLPWDRFERTLTENLAALADHHPAVAAALGSPAAVRERLAALEAHRDAAGLMHVLRPVPASAGQWVGGLCDRRAERGFTVPASGGVPVRVMILGVGTGRLVDRATSTSTTPAGAPPVHVHVIEPDLDALAAWLALADRRASLADPRLLLTAGPDALAAWTRLLTDRPGLPLPDRILVAAPDLDVEPVARARAAVVSERGASIRVALAALAERWRGVSNSEAAARLTPGATVVGFTSRYTTVLRYAMRDVADAFTALGYRFLIVEESAPGEHLAVGDIPAIIDREDAALVVTFNRHRPDSVPVFGDVPMLSLVLDPVDEILSREGGARVGPRDVLAGFYAGQATQDFGYPASRYLPLHLFPISPRTFHDAPLTPAEAERYACDLVYVGHARGTADAWHTHCLGSFPAEVHPVLDAARAQLARRPAHRFLGHAEARELVHEACRATGLDVHERVRSNIASMHVHRLHDIAWRRTALQWAARWATRTGRRLHLHGDGWADDPQFRAFARGPVTHDHEARLAYGGARLALQLLPSGLGHQRTFEALCSGSLVIARESGNDFMLMDRHAFRRAHGDGRTASGVLHDAGFRNLDELVFADEAEFTACVERWLADDAEREARRELMAGIVGRQFTWTAILPRLLDGTRAAIGLA
jgi:hypothetical protein